VFRPAEHCLAEIKGYNVTADLRELAALVGSSWPYEMAAGVLKRLSGVQLSDERLRQLTNEQGSILAKQQQAQAQQVLQEAVSMSQIRAQREASGHMPKQKQPEMLQVGPGGRMAALARAKRRHGRENWGGRQKAWTWWANRGGTGPTCAALCGYLWASRRYFRMLTYAAACDLGATEAKQQVVLADGAEWIKTQAGEHFPDAVKILDWPHLWRKIRAAVRSVQPGKHPARRAWRKEQYEVLLPLLWQGEREQALRHLHSLRPTTGEVPPPLEDAIRYLETQQDWLGNYEQWQADGYPVGSGLVERAVAVVINMRMKKRGMRWKRANATAVVALRVHYINADWEAAA